MLVHQPQGAADDLVPDAESVQFAGTGQVLAHGLEKHRFAEPLPDRRRTRSPCLGQRKFHQLR
jgi:hypothetical protein